MAQQAAPVLRACSHWARVRQRWRDPQQQCQPRLAAGAVAEAVAEVEAEAEVEAGAGAEVEAEMAEVWAPMPRSSLSLLGCHPPLRPAC